MSTDDTITSAPYSVTIIGIGDSETAILAAARCAGSLTARDHVVASAHVVHGDGRSAELAVKRRGRRIDILEGDTEKNIYSTTSAWQNENCGKILFSRLSADGATGRALEELWRALSATEQRRWIDAAAAVLDTAAT